MELQNTSITFKLINIIGNKTLNYKDTVNLIYVDDEI